MLKVLSTRTIGVDAVVIKGRVILAIVRGRVDFELLFVSDVHFKVNF
jgi:hypothetical protein